MGTMTKPDAGANGKPLRRARATERCGAATSEPALLIVLTMEEARNVERLSTEAGSGLVFDLAAGDSFTFESTRFHAWRNLHEAETVLIWINTPATF